MGTWTQGDDRNCWNLEPPFTNDLEQQNKNLEKQIVLERGEWPEKKDRGGWESLEIKIESGQGSESSSIRKKFSFGESERREEVRKYILSNRSEFFMEKLNYGGPQRGHLASLNLY